MLGRDFYSSGSRRNILIRYGDGLGKPFQGPLKLSFVNRSILAVLSTDVGSISLQVLGGNIEYTFYPLGKREKIEKRLDEEREETLWNTIHSSSKNIVDSKNDGKEQMIAETYGFIDCLPTSMCFIDNDKIVVTDQRSLIKVIDIPSRSIAKAYSRYGGEKGDITDPLGIDYLKVDGNNLLFYAVCEGGLNQRLQIFDKEFNHVIMTGEYGSKRNQFNEPFAISWDKSVIRHKNPQIPFWYKEHCSMDDMENYLYSDDAKGNFLLRRHPSDTNKYFLFDILLINKFKRLEKILIRKDKRSGKCSFFPKNAIIMNEREEEEEIDIVQYDSIFELLKSMKMLMFGPDYRDHSHIAIADRKNKRVKILRFYWENSTLYSPFIEVVHIIGGIHQRIVSLIDPVSVSYSLTSELAICDEKQKKIFIISGNMTVIKWFSLFYESPKQLLLKEKEKKKKDNEFKSVSKLSILDSLDHEKNLKYIANKKFEIESEPCSVSFNSYGNLSVGYRHGGEKKYSY